MLSCSEDKTIKIWESNRPYDNLLNISTIHSIIQLKGKEIVIICSTNKILCKWNLNTHCCEGLLRIIDYYEKTQIREAKDKICVNGMFYVTIVNGFLFTKEIIIKKNQNLIEKYLMNFYIYEDKLTICYLQFIF